MNNEVILKAISDKKNDIIRIINGNTIWTMSGERSINKIIPKETIQYPPSTKRISFKKI